MIKHIGTELNFKLTMPKDQYTQEFQLTGSGLNHSLLSKIQVLSPHLILQKKTSNRGWKCSTSQLKTASSTITPFQNFRRGSLSTRAFYRTWVQPIQFSDVTEVLVALNCALDLSFCENAICLLFLFSRSCIRWTGLLFLFFLFLFFLLLLLLAVCILQERC